jgi:hypothetical protein
MSENMSKESFYSREAYSAPEGHQSFGDDGSIPPSPRDTQPKEQEVNPLGRTELNETELSLFDEKVSVLRKSRAALPKEGDAKTRIKVSVKEKILLIPKHLFKDEDNLLGLILIKCAHDLKYKVTLCDSERYTVNDVNTETIKFFQGLALNTDDTINLKINQKKSDIIELGRAVGFALRVRSQFRNDKLLGPQALRRYQAFFGNDPIIDPRTKTLKEYMILDGYLTSYLEKSDEVDDVRHAISTLFEQKGLRDFPDEMVAAAVAQNLVEYGTILNNYRRKPLGETKPKNKSSKKSELGKLPEKPSSSPLMTKEEIENYLSLSGQIWTALESFNKDYFKSIQTVGYAQVYAKTHDVMNLRWEMLTAFANVTTKRLKELRKLNNDSKISKRKVGESDLSDLLNARQNYALEWSVELSELLRPLRVTTLEVRERIGFPEDTFELIRLQDSNKNQHILDRSSKADLIKTPKPPADGRFDELKKANREVLRARYSQTKKHHRLLFFQKDGNVKKVSTHKDNILDFLNYLIGENENSKETVSVLSDLIKRVEDQTAFGPTTDLIKTLEIQDFFNDSSWVEWNASDVGCSTADTVAYYQRINDVGITSYT